MARADTAVISPNLGLYLGMSPLSVPAKAVKDGFNFRIKDGKLTNRNLGWEQFSQVTFNGPIILLDRLVLRGIGFKTVVGTPTDIYEYDPDTDDAFFLTPIYAVGTVNVTADAVALLTTATGSPTFITEGIQEGMEI